MKIAVVTEQRLVRDRIGRYWAETGSGYEFWSRYCTAFDQVRLVARVEQRAEARTGATRVDGVAVEVAELPHYIGAMQFARKLFSVVVALKRAVNNTEAVLLRVPSPLGSLLYLHLLRRRRKYAIEVVGDPFDVFSTIPSNRVLRFFIRSQAVSLLRAQARHAVGAAYVTESTLQKRYPSGPATIRSHYSSIELKDDAFAEGHRQPNPTRTTFTLVSIGSLEQNYKGIDLLVEALAILRKQNLDVSLVHLGEGRQRNMIEHVALMNRVDDYVRLVGHIPSRSAVREYLRSADLFVLPSRTEGLPRALIEAMALGMPAIASSVGGVPELLTEQYLVPAGDATALAGRIAEILNDPQSLAQASAENLSRARDFRSDVLTARRREFYRQLRQRFSQ